MKMWGGQEEMKNCKINIDKYYICIVQLYYKDIGRSSSNGENVK